jgi:molybdopterin converting factor small subunit
VNNQDEVEVQGNSVEEAFDSLCKDFAELKPNLFDENGKVRNFINVYLNDDDIRYAEGMNSSVQDGDCIQIVPSIAGGR